MQHNWNAAQINNNKEFLSIEILRHNNLKHSNKYLEL